MSERQGGPEYLLDGADELSRLERQARLYGADDDLRHVAPFPGEGVLDAGCGAGIITRTIAQAFPQCQAVGVDRERKYIDYARQKAAAERIGNIRFEVGDVLELPFEDRSFDIVWCKHVLQWVPRREQALAEFKRVARPGGRIVCCNFDGFCASHFPSDEELQRDIDRWFEVAERELGFDRFLGRKLPSMFLEAGLNDVTVDFIPDRAFSGWGGDPEKQWNWAVQWQSALGFSEKVFGSRGRAEEFQRRLLSRFNRPDVYLFCALFYVEGRVR